MRPALSLFLLLAVFYLLTLGGHLYSPDEEILFRTTEALATRGSTAIEPLHGFATRPGRASQGLEYAQYGIGQPILAVPFYWLGRGGAAATPPWMWVGLHKRLGLTFPMIAAASGERVPLEVLGRRTATRFGVSLFNLFITAISGVVLYWLARRQTRAPRAAWFAALLWGAGSMAWPHARTFFTEPLAGLCLLIALERLSAYFEARNGSEPEQVAAGRSPTLLVVLAAGVAAGYGCLVRIDSVVFLPGLALLAVWGDYGRSGSGETPPETVGLRDLSSAIGHLFRLSTLARLFVFAAPIAVAGGVILGLNAWRFGHPLATGYGDQPEGVAFTTPVLAGLYGFFLSVGKGVFFFSPPLILGFWGLRPMLKRRPQFGVALLVVIGAFLLFHSCWRNWAGGWCWGPRHIMQLHALWAVPIAFWLGRGVDRKRALLAGTLLVLGVAVQVYGCSQNFVNFYDTYFRDPRPPTAHPLYDVQSNAVLGRQYAVFLRDPRTGELGREISPALLPAPINDSIYILQNSQWTGYARLWRERGVHDFFWLHAVRLFLPVYPSPHQQTISAADGARE